MRDTHANVFGFANNVCNVYLCVLMLYCRQSVPRIMNLFTKKDYWNITHVQTCRHPYSAWRKTIFIFKYIKAHSLNRFVMQGGLTLKRNSVVSIGGFVFAFTFMGLRVCFCVCAFADFLVCCGISVRVKLKT